MCLRPCRPELSETFEQLRSEGPCQPAAAEKAGRMPAFAHLEPRSVFAGQTCAHGAQSAPGACESANAELRGAEHSRFQQGETGMLMAAAGKGARRPVRLGRALTDWTRVQLARAGYCHYVDLVYDVLLRPGPTRPSSLARRPLGQNWPGCMGYACRKACASLKGVIRRRWRTGAHCPRKVGGICSAPQEAL